MMPTSVSSRLALVVQLMAITVVVLFAASSLLLTARVLKRGERTFLTETAQRVAGNLDREFQEEGDLRRAAAAAMEDESAQGVRIDVRDEGGKILASTNPASPGSPVSDSTAPRSATREDSANLQIAVVRSASGAIVTVSVSDRLRSAGVAALGRALLLTALPVLLLTLVLSRWVVRRALRPLAVMERRAREVSVERGVRSLGPPSGLREIDELGAAFDRLLVRLDDLLRSERRFTSDASHELLTPLTVLSGEIEMALAQPDLSFRARAGLERALDQAAAMRDLVEALLLLRRAGQSEHGGRDGFEPVNLSDLAAETVREAVRREPSRSDDVALSAPDEVLVSGHPVLLGSALQNLVGNALKFTQAGQRVQVTIEGASEARVRVDDGGRGIVPGERDRIFNPFFRGAEARADHTGFGLGLPILREVARVHGGDVSVEESPLGGARFVLRLPLWSSGGLGVGGLDLSQ